MISLVLDHLLESTAFAVLMALLTLCFANNRAAVRYGLWFAASIKFLVPFSLIVAAGHALRWHTAPAVRLDLTWSAPVAVADLHLPPALPDLAALPAAVPAAIAHGPSGLDPGSLLIMAWLGGMVLLLCRWTWQWVRLSLVRWASTPSGINVGLPVRFSRALFEPGLVGVFRPVLLLPEGITAQLTPKQLALVIEHEFCHWRRCDNLTAAIHMIVELVFWFHPLVWWIGARLVTERERACDEGVLASGSDPKAYASSILEVCRFYVRSPLPCASGVAGANLTHRVRRIMENVTSTRLGAVKLALLAGIGASAILVPMASGLFTAEAIAAPPLASVSPPAPAQILPLPKPAPTARRKTHGAVKVALPARAAAAPAPQGEQPAPQPHEEEIAAASVSPEAAPAAAPAPASSSPMDEIVVTAKKIREFVRTRNFVRTYTAPSDFLDQIARWHAPLCVHTEGLAAGYDAFVTARVAEIAAEIGAPKALSDHCKTNLAIIFSEHPQQLLDYIRTKRPELLGPHYPALTTKIATVTHPVQAWYATGTRDSHGRMEIDSYDGWNETPDGSPPVYDIWLASHLRTGLSSEFASVVVVADIKQVENWEIGTIADYIAMLAFARTNTFDKCQQVPSITNALGDCSDGVKATALSDYDIAYLKALYSSTADAPRGLQESGISRVMLNILEKQVAEKKSAADVH